MFSINIHADNIEELREHLSELNSAFNGDLVAKEVEYVGSRTGEATEPIKPVLTQAQMEENTAKAPVHELPPTISIEEVRKALNDLKALKGIESVKALLKEYGVNSVPELPTECYLQIRDRAYAEVGELKC